MYEFKDLQNYTINKMDYYVSEERNGRKYLVIKPITMEYLIRVYGKTKEFGPAWEQAYQEMYDDGWLIDGRTLEEEKIVRYLTFLDLERTHMSCYVCQTCLEICKGEPYKCLMKHKCYHDGIEEKKEEYPCEVCEKLFKNKQNLKNHEKSKGHLRKVQAVQDTNRHYCRPCDKTSATTKLLRKHETTCELHKKIASGKFCKHCDKMFSSRDSFKRHHKKHHPVVF